MHSVPTEEMAAILINYACRREMPSIHDRARRLEIQFAVDDLEKGIAKGDKAKTTYATAWLREEMDFDVLSEQGSSRRSRR